jgi:predicted TIM-barrel fold metal-dependent hydrolase
MSSRSPDPVPVIDGFVNPVLWSWDEAPDFVRAALGERMRATLDAAARLDPADLVAEMEASGVSHAIANAPVGLWEQVLDVVQAYPEHFSFSVEVDPRQGMTAVRDVERAVGDHGAVLVRMVPFMIGLPPSDRVYYPIFSKCIELGVPVAVNTGIPAAPMPAEVQRPLHLDEVLRHFPELRVIMQHGADPWWDEAIALLNKYDNLRLMTSAWAPRYLPPSLLRFMDGRGAGKVLWGSDYPVLSFERCLREARALDLRPDALDAFLGGAADGFLTLRAQPSSPAR